MHLRPSLFIAAACFFLVASAPVAAATLGGTVSAIAGTGACNDSSLVPANTQQDSLTLHAFAACKGGLAMVDLTGNAVTASVGVSALSQSSSQGSTQAAAMVQYTDHWLIGVPAGTAPGVINIPVALRLEGTVSSGALSTFNRFLDYSLSIRDLYAPPIPDPPYMTIFSATGSVSTTGPIAQRFDGSVNFSYFGPGSLLPTTAEVEMILFIPQLDEGAVDFHNTASISLVLPQGFTATTSSGLPLVFAVPEPHTYAMLAAGLGLLGFMRRRKRA